MGTIFEFLQSTLFCVFIRLNNTIYCMLRQRFRFRVVRVRPLRHLCKKPQILYTNIYKKASDFEKYDKKFTFLAFCRRKQANICLIFYIRLVTKWVRFGYSGQKTLKSNPKFCDIFAAKSRFFRSFAGLRAKTEHDRAVPDVCRYST